MGARSERKRLKKQIDHRFATLRKIGLSFPDDLAHLPNSKELFEIYMEAAGRFVDGYQKGVTPSGLTKGVVKNLRLLDRLLNAIPEEFEWKPGKNGSLPCKAGCSYCCTVRVTTTAPFVLVIADDINERFSPSERTALVERLQAHFDATKVLSPSRQVLNNRMCPLNVNGLCTIYAVRPLGCRTYHSYDVDKCREDVEFPDKEVLVPQDSSRFAAQSLVIRAVSDCTARLGLNDDELELVPALLIALTGENVAERYIGGEPVFASAHRKELQEAQLKDLRNRVIPLRLVPTEKS